MSFTWLLLSVLLATVLCQNLPTKTNYVTVVQMENYGTMPWPDAGNSPPYKIITNAELKQLGQQYFPNIPASQNSTAMALCIYDWTMPDFRRPNFIRLSNGNITTLGALITYSGINSYPDVLFMFGLNATTIPAVLAQLKQEYNRVHRWGNSQANILGYALEQMPQTPYTQIPQLFRGGGRDIEFGCGQFNNQSVYMGVDDCISTYFWNGGQVRVETFWSTSSDEAQTLQYAQNIMYNIVSNAQRTGWHARDIHDFSIDQSQVEYLYPPQSGFQVQSVDCVTNSNGSPMWNITLMELGYSANIPPPNPNINFTTCVGV